MVLADKSLRRSQDFLDSAVRAARRQGCTWAELATALGYESRQAVQQRFKHVGSDQPLRPG